jgi:hypothetical protein
VKLILFFLTGNSILIQRGGSCPPPSPSRIRTQSREREEHLLQTKVEFVPKVSNNTKGKNKHHAATPIANSSYPKPQRDHTAYETHPQSRTQPFSPARLFEGTRRYLRRKVVRGVAISGEGTTCWGWQYVTRIYMVFIGIIRHKYIHVVYNSIIGIIRHKYIHVVYWNYTQQVGNATYELSSSLIYHFF